MALKRRPRDCSAESMGQDAGLPRRTEHTVLVGDSRDLSAISDSSVDLVVTSPPYPMIEMWDEIFRGFGPAIGAALDAGEGMAAFEPMHKELDRVWAHCFRVLKPGGFACINIGDAVRTINGEFRIYSNHARILMGMVALGFHALPDVLWRKQTNAPNKFMGSGMLPAGAYVTYEHEYILIFRKGGKREFDTEELKARRRESAYFWEERNVWFSDIWSDLKGARQELGDKAARARSGAYPFELAYRLICMYSVCGDTVLDPFLGTGTTSAAAIAACRNSIGVELHQEMLPVVAQSMAQAIGIGSDRIRQRVADHLVFVGERQKGGGQIKHRNATYDFPVMTAQETGIALSLPESIQKRSETLFEVDYGNYHDAAPQAEQLSLFGEEAQGFAECGEKVI